MVKEIVYKDYTNKSVEVCRELCNELMAYQAKQAVIGKEFFEAMTFENRLNAAFNQATIKSLIVAFNEDTPVGYIFLTADTINEEAKNYRPDWIRRFSADGNGLFPDWLKTPAKVATLNNLYISPEYRGHHIGKRLTEHGMNWLENSYADYFFVYVSNGNNVAPFYEKLGFKFSHPVFGGLIDAYYIKRSPVESHE